MVHVTIMPVGFFKLCSFKITTQKQDLTLTLTFKVNGNIITRLAVLISIWLNIKIISAIYVVLKLSAKNRMDLDFGLQGQRHLHH